MPQTPMPEAKPMPAVKPETQAQPLPKAATEDPASTYYPIRNGGEQSLRQNRLGDLFGAPN
jgi:hypothetical protein